MTEQQKVPRQELNLFDICQSAVPEIFARELSEVLRNIADINTDATKTRRIVLTFDFNPYPDRSAFTCSLQAKSGLAGSNFGAAAQGVAYLMKSEVDGKVKIAAYSRDIRQQSLWDKEEEAPADGKSAGAADKVVGIGN